MISPERIAELRRLAAGSTAPARCAQCGDALQPLSANVGSAWAPCARCAPPIPEPTKDALADVDFERMEAYSKTLPDEPDEPAPALAAPRCATCGHTETAMTMPYETYPLRFVDAPPAPCKTCKGSGRNPALIDRLALAMVGVRVSGPKPPRDCPDCRGGKEPR